MSRAFQTIVLVSLLAACGGGGGGGAPAARGGDFSKFAQICAMPRHGTDPESGQPYADAAGSLRDEQRWLDAYMHELYLWYREVPNVDAAAYTVERFGHPWNAMAVYFYRLLTPQTTASGKPKDAYSFVYPTAEWQALSQEGRVIGYGLSISWADGEHPVIVQIDPGMPAAAAGLGRGMQILAVDGADARSASKTVYDGLFPAEAGEDHRLTVNDPAVGSTRDIFLRSDHVVLTPVRNVTVLETVGGPVGYLPFDDHIATAEGLLIDAIRQLKADGIRDLVLDLRYNGGGYLDIAGELAFMIAGATATTGKVFERMQFNDRHPYRDDPRRDTPFHANAVGIDPSVTEGTALPQLGLRRVFVLSTSDTCSASEALINGLRGIGVQVILIGDTTCGKPYGFRAQDNCGLSYFAIEFMVVNAQGFGDYADGLTPDCDVADDFDHALGDPEEALLAAALSYRESGKCPAAAAKRAATPRRMIREPVRQNRILR